MNIAITKLIKTLLFVFWVIAGAVLKGYSQNNCSIVGKVSDVETGKTLKGAAVTLDDEKTNITSDSAGRFRVLVACSKEYTLKVSYVGYIPYVYRFEAKGEKELNIGLANKNSQLEEVVVTSQGAVRNTETPALGVNMMSMRSIEKLPPAAGEVDILRSLQMLPGISSVGEGANGINVRGGNVDQNLIYLDNMPIFNPTHLLGLFSLFPTDAVREIDVYKGSIPARYGGRTSSVLDVKLTEPSLESFKLKGGIGLISNRLSAEIPVLKDKLSLLLSARASYNEYLVNLYNGAFVDTRVEKPIPNNHANFYDLAGKILYKPTEKDNITFSTYRSNDQYSVDSLFAIAGALANKAAIHYGHQNYALRWNHFYNNQLNFNVLAASSDYSTRTESLDSANALVFNTDVAYKNIKAEATYIPNSKHRAIGGISGIRYDIEPGNLEPLNRSGILPVSLQKEQAYETALYGSDEYEISDRLLIDGGLRIVQYFNIGPYQQALYAENQPKTLNSIIDTASIRSGGTESSYLRWEPRLALRYKLDEKNSLKAGYNRMNQFIQILSNNTTPLPNARWQTSNRYIPPEQSDLFSVGFFHDTKERFWEYSIEAYYKTQSALFDYTNGANLATNTAIETQLVKGTGRAYGVEFLLNKKKGVMTGWVSYTYARALEKVTGDFPASEKLNNGDWFPSSIDKPHSLNAAINFQSERHNTWSFIFVYNSGRPYTAPVSFYRVYDQFVPVFTDRNNGRLPDYHRLDFSWTIKPSRVKAHWESSWVFAVYNLYGHRNVYSYFFKPNGLGFKPLELSVFPAPIASLTYNATIK